jgi:hypothetical protein
MLLEYICYEASLFDCRANEVVMKVAVDIFIVDALDAVTYHQASEQEKGLN